MSVLTVLNTQDAIKDVKRAGIDARSRYDERLAYREESQRNASAEAAEVAASQARTREAMETQMAKNREADAEAALEEAEARAEIAAQNKAKRQAARAEKIDGALQTTSEIYSKAKKGAKRIGRAGLRAAGKFFKTGARVVKGAVSGAKAAYNSTS
jgi:hypothetical protein